MIRPERGLEDAIDHDGNHGGIQHVNSTFLFPPRNSNTPSVALFPSTPKKLSPPIKCTPIPHGTYEFSRVLSSKILRKFTTCYRPQPNHGTKSMIVSISVTIFEKSVDIKSFVRLKNTFIGSNETRFPIEVSYCCHDMLEGSRRILVSVGTDTRFSANVFRFSYQICTFSFRVIGELSGMPKAFWNSCKLEITPMQRNRPGECGSVMRRTFKFSGLAFCRQI